MAKKLSDKVFKSAFDAGFQAAVTPLSVTEVENAFDEGFQSAIVYLQRVLQEKLDEAFDEALEDFKMISKKTKT